LAESIVTSVSAHKIIIICKGIEQKVIESLLNQIGWKARIQSIITIDELISWYEKALRGTYSSTLGDRILFALSEEIKSEFPSVGRDDFQVFKQKRGYDIIQNGFWDINT
jgi:type II restriction enzyme